MTQKIVTLVSAAGLILGATSLAVGQSSNSPQTPGHKMQERGSVKGEPGASGYSPGHQMQDKGSKRGQPGASGYAPGHSKQNTGSSGSSPRR